MTCFSPMHGYKRPDGGFTTSPARGYVDLPMTVPCRKCIGCRLKHSRTWAIRAVHEAQMHERNSFLTLTYAPAALRSPSLILSDMQDFWKRLRKEIPVKIKNYYCGEYGEKNRRPHFHACVFGWDADDKRVWKVERGHKYYVSEFLSHVWGHGHVVIGDLTFESAAYTARYVTKKIFGDRADDHYRHIDPVTGEVTQLVPEFAHMSRREGIGLPWLQRYWQDVFPDDFCLMNGRKVEVPRYYDEWFKLRFPVEFEAIKRARLTRARNRAEDSTPDRLAVREAVQYARFEKLMRSLE